MDIRQYMQQWQTEHDQPVDWTNKRQLKWHLTYDTWDNRFFVESVSGYRSPGMVYFSSREAAQRFLSEHQEELLNWSNSTIN